jgi:hypothetical protein
VLAATTIRRHVATLSHRLENTDADAIAIEQRRHIDPSAGRFDIPQRSSVRAVGIDAGSRMTSRPIFRRFEFHRIRNADGTSQHPAAVSIVVVLKTVNSPWLR